MPSASLVLPPTPAANTPTSATSRAARSRPFDPHSASDARESSPSRASSFREALGRAERGGPRHADRSTNEAARDDEARDARDEERVDTDRPDRAAKSDKAAKPKSGKTGKAEGKSRRGEARTDEAADGAEAGGGEADAATAEASPESDDAGSATDDATSHEGHEHCAGPNADAHAADPTVVPVGLVNPNPGAATTAPTDAAKAETSGDDGDAPKVATVTGATGSAGDAAAKVAKAGESAAQDEADATAAADQLQPPAGGRSAGARRSPGLGQPAAEGRGGREAAAADADTQAHPGQPAATADGTTAFQQFADMFAPSAGGAADSVKPAAGGRGDAAPSVDASAAAAGQPQQAREAAKPAAPAAPEPPAEARFAADNHEKIVDGVRGELLPNGGTMKLKLDPPELGALQVSLHMKDGVVTASFQTSNDDATRMLSHSLSDLRSTLEAHGIVVDKLHVQQAPKDEGSGNSGGDRGSQQQTLEQRGDARRDQQRKDMVQRLWDKLAGKGPLDITA